MEAENGQYKEEYAEISQMDVTALEADEETSKELKDKFDDRSFFWIRCKYQPRACSSFTLCQP